MVLWQELVKVLLSDILECNNIYYEGMKYIKDNSLDIKMIFIHIPSINTKFDIEKIAKTISNFIETLND